MEPLEEFYRFADVLPDALMLVSGDGEVLAVNRRTTEFCGHGTSPAATLVGRGLADLAPADADGLAAWLRLCARSREPVPGNLRFGNESGAPVRCRALGAVYRPRSSDRPALILLRLTPAEDAVDPFVALNLRIEELHTEMARRRLAEQAVQAEREWLRVTLESIGDAVIATDAAGCVTFLNPVAEALTGWAQAEAAGRPLDEVFVIVNEETLKTVESPVARVLREGVIVGLANHTVLVRRDGSRFPIDDSGAPIRDEHGEIIGVVLVFHDVSQQRRLERELEERNRSLLDADRRKDEFLAMLAHELRNPLAPLRSSLDVLAMGETDARTLANVTAMMSRQVQHLTHLVNDLLDVSRITRGTIALRREPVLLQGVLRHALEMIDEQMRQRRHEVSLQLPEQPMLVDGDAHRLAQVFSNLLSNAAKFTPPGGRVAVSAQAGDRWFTVRVSDTGLGIEPELTDAIFELFTQGDRSLDRSQGGLGLGLTVAKRVVEMHGGTIAARSDGPDLGSEFVVTLPALDSSADSSRQGSAQPAQRETARSPRRVLVVDDNVDAAEALALLVKAWGHQVQVAHDGERALEVGPEFRPDVVLLDLGLPLLDGFEVARRMRRHPDMADARLVAVTGYGRNEDRLVTSEAGFDDHLVKPVEPGAVADLLADRDLPAQR